MLSKQGSLKHKREFPKGRWTVCGAGILEEKGRISESGKAISIHFTALHSGLGHVDCFIQTCMNTWQWLCGEFINKFLFGESEKN